MNRKVSRFSIQACNQRSPSFWLAALLVLTLALVGCSNRAQPSPPTPTRELAQLPTPRPTFTPINPQTPPSITISPPTLMPGAMLRIQGSGFGASEVVEIQIQPPDGTGAQIVLAGTDNQGNFLITHTLGEDAPLGTYQAVALGKQSALQATTTFAVNFEPTPTPIVVQIETLLATATPETGETPFPLYRLTSTLGGIDCTYYGFFGTVQNADGSPRAGVNVLVFREGSSESQMAVTNDAGFWEVVVARSQEDVAPGLWHLVIVEQSVRASDEIALDMPASCEEGRPNKFKVDWQRVADE
ncbi:hypothetical protein ARMA_1383 [Ardenticatena maritima]|uniref:Uncharacterized protein n=1 Tax=Ardenticatena maritima TaxID=872965 RepID=A0A0M9UCI1_9CHLR|nr:carboxypeptidase-like regulatory domain-containing protein [Ardenticatena maritima]KPL88220.1 hypothetical protein SE16_05005 [Ardenticatena maritima]GAP62960.1 hypothetical protein ARMA_1383 [Ardenticatena maritima]